MPDMSEEIAATRENRRRAALSADGWTEGRDNLWRKGFDQAEWLPTCDVGCVTHSVVRDWHTGVAQLIMTTEDLVVRSRRPGTSMSLSR